MVEAIGTYKDLQVWQKAMKFVEVVYFLIREFPAFERYALSDQLRRAVISVPSNIAEGNGRASNKDYAHFLSIARGSLYETMTQVELAKNLGYISASIDDIEVKACELSKMLTAMIKRFSPESIAK